MFGGQCSGAYTKCVLDLSRVCQNYGIQVQFSFIFNESLITRARAYLVDEFLRSDATHMIFIDADIDFNPMDVIALMALDKPIIGGLYPKKALAWENIYDAARYGLVPTNDRSRLSDFAGDLVFNAIPGTTELKLNEPVEVLETGTGFFMVQRWVFEKYAEAYPQYWFTPDHNRSTQFDGSRKCYMYFQAEIDETSNRYLSEDYRFCQLARKIGISTWIAPWMQLKHHGSYVFGGSIQAMATVINERIKRNDPVPATVKMDGPQHPQGVVTEGPLTIKQFYGLSVSKRNVLFTEWSQKFALDITLIKDYYKTHRDEWLTTQGDTPIEELFSTFAATQALKPKS